MNRHQYEDDFFADTRMSFGDHLEELRKHLIRAMIGFAIGMFLSLFIGQRVVIYIAEPVEQALVQFYKERAQAVRERTQLDPDHPLNAPRDANMLLQQRDLWLALRQLNPKLVEGVAEPPAEAPPIELPAKVKDPVGFVIGLQDIQQTVGRAVTLKALSVTEAFVVYFKVCIICGFVVSSPWVFYQVWSFIGAGLYPHEKKLVNYYLPFSIFLFIAGVFVTERWIIPNALDALLAFNKWLEVEPDFRLTDWLSFALWTPVVAGLCFQTPLVMLFLAKIGLFTAEQYLAKWRIAALVMLIAAAIGPTIDYVTLGILWGSMIGLYLLGIVLVKWTVKPYVPIEEEEITFQPQEASSNGEQRH